MTEVIETLRRFLRGGHRYSDVITEIVNLVDRAPGWNSYHAPRVASDAQVRAIALVNDFDKLSGLVPPPAVGATPEGGVALRWLTRDREIDIHFTGIDGEFAVLRRGTTEVVLEGNLRQVDPLKDIVQAHVMGYRSLESFR
jgi:hypothetical protein